MVQDGEILELRYIDFFHILRASSFTLLGIYYIQNPPLFLGSRDGKFPKPYSFFFFSFRIVFVKRSFNVLYEDRDLVAVTKNAGLLTIATDKDDRHTLYHYVRDYLNNKHQKVFVVHRLDRDTSGIVVFAKNPGLKEELQDCFESGEVNRYYEAIVKETVPYGKTFRVEEYLAFDPKSGNVYVTSDPQLGKKAVTLIKAHQHNKLGTVLDIKILTGRRNQIRLALKTLGLTLLGDKKYAKDNDSLRMFLNEYEIDFPERIGLRQSSFSIKPLWLGKDEE